MKTRWAAATLLLIPFCAQANAGTPLMWAGMLHLMFGNLLIGILEGLLLGWLFKAPKGKAISLLIAANYLSAWAGAFLVERLTRLPDITIENLKPWLIFFFVLAFILTLLIELPFFRAALRKRERSFRAAIKPTVLIHLISYALLTVWYGMASGTSILKLNVVAASELQPAAGYTLYFISNDGKTVIRQPLSSEAPEAICDISSTNRNDRLFARMVQGGGFNLSIRYDAERPRNYTVDTLLLNVAQTASQHGLQEKDPQGDPGGTWNNFGEVPALAASNGWKYRTGFWAGEGISGEGPGGENFRYALETPFASWNIRNAISLGDSLLVFQLGREQVCILDHHSKRIALLARGRGPLVAAQP
ncbi:hypothetical protein P4B35_10485 [Pontiellaceae bacterium B12227]|nr:hypothetical protein [Pontiellaceae bacterium B12227]